MQSTAEVAAQVELHPFGEQDMIVSCMQVNGGPIRVVRVLDDGAAMLLGDGTIDRHRIRIKDSDSRTCCDPLGLVERLHAQLGKIESQL